MTQQSAEDKAAADAKAAEDAAAADAEAKKPRGKTAVSGVHVHTEDGTVIYNAGDKIPGEHVALISNPKVFALPDQD